MTDEIEVPETMQEVEPYGKCPICGKPINREEVGHHDPRAMCEDDHIVFKREVEIIEEE